MKTLQGLSHKVLSELFLYNPDSGHLTRRVSVQGRGKKCLTGSVVGSVDGKGYLHVMVKGRFVRLHRLIFFLLNGYVPKYIDHRDGNRLNNRKTNLRHATVQQNMGNFKVPRHNTSGFRGVSKNSRSGKWHAQIKINGKQTYLGRFDTPEDAARRYDRAALEHFKEFARINYAG